MRRDLHASAVDLARHGFAVLPLGPDKAPLTRHGLTTATTDLDTIDQTWWRWPNAWIGVRCDDLLVVDLDLKDGRDGIASWGELAGPHGWASADTRAHRTRSGGRHLVYGRPPGVLAGVNGSSNDLGPGIDTRVGQSYVVWPPSPGYTVEVDAPIADAPAWLSDAVAEARQPAPPTRPATGPVVVRGAGYGAAALRGEAERVATAAVGTRNRALNVAAFKLGRLVGGGVLDQREVESVLGDAASRCGLGGAEAERTIRSGLGAGIAQPRTPAA